MFIKMNKSLQYLIDWNVNVTWNNKTLYMSCLNYRCIFSFSLPLYQAEAKNFSNTWLFNKGTQYNADEIDIDSTHEWDEKMPNWSHQYS